MKVGLLGNGFFTLTIIDALISNDVEVYSLNQDYQLLDDSQQNLLAEKLTNRGVLLNKDFANYVDLLLVFNYNKIINTEEYKNIPILNVHMGLLPKWRGNSANTWAVLNGEQFVGYTIHLINDELDSGDIVYQFKCEVDLNSSYSHTRNTILKDLEMNIAHILRSYMSNEVNLISQSNSEYIYCSKIRKSDGVIKSWNLPSTYFKRLQYLFMNEQFGLTFLFKGNVYQVGKVNLLKSFANSLGIPGGVVNQTESSIWVKTSDTAIELSEIKLGNQSINISEHFKIGYRLGDS